VENATLAFSICCVEKQFYNSADAPVQDLRIRDEEKDG